MPDVSQKMLARAIELGIQGAETMEFNELSKAMSKSPATKEQEVFVNTLMEHIGQNLPSTLTYGRARQVIHAIAPIIDENVLMDKQWVVGTILNWQDSHYQITAIHSDFKFSLRRVEYAPAQGEHPALITHTTSAIKVRHPFILSGEATIVPLP